MNERTNQQKVTPEDDTLATVEDTVAGWEGAIRQSGIQLF